MVRLDTNPDDLKRYSSHLLHVWACVPDEAGKFPKHIKKRLCWLSDSFRMYLRDTARIQHQHLDALQVALQEVMYIIMALPKNVIAMSTMTDGSDDSDMHKYADGMD
jgi:hypothetical protein